MPAVNNVVGKLPLYISVSSVQFSMYLCSAFISPADRVCDELVPKRNNSKSICATSITTSRSYTVTPIFVLLTSIATCELQ